MAASTVLLNAETSQPQERAEHDLSPKSYADAVFTTNTESSERSDAKDTNTVPVNGHIESHAASSTAGNVNGYSPANHESPEPANASDAGGDKADEMRADIDKVFYENQVDDVGNNLISVEPSTDYRKQLEHGQDTAPPEKKKSQTTDVAKKQSGKSHLASGRRAGAGWQRSA